MVQTVALQGRACRQAADDVSDTLVHSDMGLRCTRSSPASLQPNWNAVAFGFFAVTMAWASLTESIRELLNPCSGERRWQQNCNSRQSCRQHELADGSLDPEQLFHDPNAGSLKAHNIPLAFHPLDESIWCCP